MPLKVFGKFVPTKGFKVRKVFDIIALRVPQYIDETQFCISTCPKKAAGLFCVPKGMSRCINHCWIEQGFFYDGFIEVFHDSGVKTAPIVCFSCILWVKIFPVRQSMA